MKIKNVERIITAKNSKYISITICVEGNKSLGWEEIQSIKDKIMPNVDFIEIYPKEDEVINKANERHLIHIVDWQCPYMYDLEIESDIEIIEVSKLTEFVNMVKSAETVDLKDAVYSVDLEESVDSYYHTININPKTI